jgi:SAM-dependent methyltransferase
VADAAPPLRLRAADPGPAVCKVCGGEARPFGAVDFNRSCEEVRGKVLPATGVAVPYRRCARCGLIFTDAFDDWSFADFETHIYNAAYVDIDPDFAAVRPDANAGPVARTFEAAAPGLRVLDYGGGNGRLAENLRAAGFPLAQTYDPFYPDFRTRPAGRFDLVTCFETLEHMPDPKRGAADIASFLEEGGMLLFSTLIQPDNIAEVGMGWPYIGPRNGHVTLHCRASLETLWGLFGLNVASFNDNLHVAYATVPTFARHLF